MQRGGRPRGRGPRAGGARAASDAAGARRDAARRANLPRRTAYDVLAAVREREAYANLLLPKLLAERGLTGRDAALATELAYGTLRGQGTYDAVLGACSDRSLAKLDPPVLDILRLGAHQLLNTRVGAHAAVATSVDLAKSVIGPRVSGYVNAVLRRVALRDLAAWLEIVAPDRAADEDGYLATRYSHPSWIVAAYRAALGDKADAPLPEAAVLRREGMVDSSAHPGVQNYPPSAPVAEGEHQGAAPGGGAAVTELAAALAAGNARPRVTMAAFPSGAARGDVMPADAEPGRWSPYAFTLESGDPAPLIEAGTAAVQDEGSQLAAIALSRAPVAPGRGGSDGGAGPPDGDSGDVEPELWLDLCAGPGGKARMLYGLAGTTAKLVAAELHPHRAALVREAIARTARSAPMAPSASGAPGRGRSYEVLVADGTAAPWPENAFDRVLLDVPCSGLGALRRHPEARWRKSKGDLKKLTALQRDLLRSALKAVRPGGVVAYVTCSPVPAETADVVTDVAGSAPGTEVLDAPAALGNVPEIAAADPRFAQLWPHRHGTDAIFIALLRKRQRG